MNNFKSFLALILLIGYINCASVNLTAFKADNYVDFQCSYNLNSTEKLDKLQIYKDEKLFYWIINNTESNNLTGIKLISPGHFQFPINKTIGAVYKCSLFYNNKTQSLDDSKTMNFDKTVDLKAKISMSKVNSTNNSSLITVQCSTTFNKGDQSLDYLCLTKDGKEFVRMDKNNQVTWTKQPGTEEGKNVTGIANTPVLSFNMNTTQESKGKYQCLINYINSNETIDTRIIDEVQWNSADTQFSNHQFLYLAIFIFKFIIN